MLPRGSWFGVDGQIDPLDPDLDTPSSQPPGQLGSGLGLGPGPCRGGSQRPVRGRAGQWQGSGGLARSCLVGSGREWSGLEWPGMVGSGDRGSPGPGWEGVREKLGMARE